MYTVERFFYGGKNVTRLKIIHKTNLIEMVSLFLYAKKAGSVANKIMITVDLPHSVLLFLCILD